MTDLLDQTLATQLAQVADGTHTPEELLAATHARLRHRDGSLRAVVAQVSDPAQSTTTKPEGPAIGIKDIIDVAGLATLCGSHAHAQPQSAEEHPPQDAACVARLRRAGFAPMAKLATYEYALTGPAWDQPNLPARNPWNTDHITGGSSSGSAAAVAGGLFRAALGTDTGGSIRAPAAYCGIVGLKPTFGRVPMQGCFPLAPSLDVIGPLAATVAEAALVLQALAPETRATEELGRTIDGLRIGYARAWFAEDPACHPDVLRAMDDSAARLSQLGARIVLIDLPDYALLEEAGTVILQAEAWVTHRERLASHGDSYGVDARRNLVTGAVLTENHLARARSVARQFRAAVDAQLANVSALLTATVLSPAPKFSDFEDGPVWTAMRTIPFNMSGHPALSLPCGFTVDNGLPIGAQLIASHDNEALLCRIGHALEQASPFSAITPALPRS